MTEPVTDELGETPPPEAEAPAIVTPEPPMPLTRGQSRRHVAVAFGFTLILLLPMYLTGHVWGYDWTVHLWMTWVQGHNIAEGAPSLLVHFDRIGVFYPFYSFYGGSWYAIGGTLMQLLGGDPVISYVLLWTFAFFWAYAGVLWLSLQAGLRGWQAHAGPLVLVTASYYLTDAYARGAYGEFIATSAVPMVIASTAYLLRAREVRAAPAAALIWSTMMFTSAHNISLSWGGLFLVSMVIVTLWALPRHGRELRLGRIAGVFALGVLGVAANMWYLLPDLMYAGRTTVANGWSYFADISAPFARPSVLFDPFRNMPKESTTPGLYTNLPVLVILWTLIYGWFIVRKSDRSLRRAWAGLFVVGFLLTLLLWNFLWPHVPRTLQFVQFSYRLQSYILIALAILTITVLAAARTSPRGRTARRVLVPILAFGFLLAVWQSWATDDMTGNHRQDTFKGGVHVGPPTWYDPGAYRDATATVVGTTPDRVMKVPFDQIKHNAFTGSVDLPAGDGAIDTNIAGGSYFVHVTGPVKQVGRDPDGNMVVKRTDPTAPAGPVPLHIELASSFPIVAGRRISLLALVSILAVLIWLAVRHRATSRAEVDETIAAGGPPTDEPDEDTTPPTPHDPEPTPA